MQLCSPYSSHILSMQDIGRRRRKREKKNIFTICYSKYLHFYSIIPKIIVSVYLHVHHQYHWSLISFEGIRRVQEVDQRGSYHIQYLRSGNSLILPSLTEMMLNKCLSSQWCLSLSNSWQNFKMAPQKLKYNITYPGLITS